MLLKALLAFFLALGMAGVTTSFHVEDDPIPQCGPCPDPSPTPTR